MPEGQEPVALCVVVQCSGKSPMAALGEYDLIRMRRQHYDHHEALSRSGHYPISLASSVAALQVSKASG